MVSRAGQGAVPLALRYPASVLLGWGQSSQRTQRHPVMCVTLTGARLPNRLPCRPRRHGREAVSIHDDYCIHRPCHRRSQDSS